MGSRYWAAVAALVLGGCNLPERSAQPAAAAAGVTNWRFDRLDRIAGNDVHVEGDPRLIATGAGPAVLFDGVDDALYLGAHPLAGAATFTIEAILRPDGGAFEQRWLHLAAAPANRAPDDFTSAPPSGPRLMFELRVVDEDWYLDAFAAGEGYRAVLMVPEKRHALARWHHVAQVYDGRSYRSYVDGVLQAEAEIAFKPQGPGYASIGTRIDRRSYFKGAVFEARFTRGALAPSQFLKVPAALR